MTFLYTALALVAFASNSLLCRLALGAALVDAASFTTIRLVSGAAVLASIAVVRQRKGPPEGGPHGKGRANRPPDGGPHTWVRGVRLQAVLDGERRPNRASWKPAVVLFAYAITFSFAYVSLPVATGALILFGAVQTTMLAAAIRAGERPRPLEWAGLLIAVAGLVYLVSPGLAAPSPIGSVLMTASGVAWGWYSLLGRRSTNPIGETTANFVRSVPLAAAASLLAIGALHLTSRGALMAAVSGGVTSGLGYVAWYIALPRLTAVRAATVQLATPALTATGGVLLLSEAVSARLAIAAALILGGIGVAVFSRLRSM